MNLCLSRTEIAELTRACTRKRQLAFLRSNGVKHYIDPHGWPVVTRAAVEGSREPEQHVRGWKPNKAA